MQCGDSTFRFSFSSAGDTGAVRTYAAGGHTLLIGTPYAAYCSRLQVHSAAAQRARDAGGEGDAADSYSANPHKVAGRLTRWFLCSCSGAQCGCAAREGRRGRGGGGDGRHDDRYRRIRRAGNPPSPLTHSTYGKSNLLVQIRLLTFEKWCNLLVQIRLIRLKT
jgi:hypothetical protein